jgi:hypothetical protein
MSARIDRLRIRASGLTPEQARRLGESVARQLAEMSPGRTPQQIAALTLRVRAGGGAVERLAADIAAAIGRKVGRR